jgi:hypothetical protein
MGNPKKYLTTSEAAEIIGHKKKTLENWRWRSQGPPYLKLGHKCLYDRDKIYEWAAKHSVNPEG